MGWVYNKNDMANVYWEADDYKRLPALRQDNIWQMLVGQDQNLMDKYFHGTFELPMTNDFFNNAKVLKSPTSIEWAYPLGTDSSGYAMTAICVAGEERDTDVSASLDVVITRGSNAIYQMRYEWMYWNECVNKDDIDYIRENCPDISEGRWDRAAGTHHVFGVGGDRGMEEDLIPITWAEVNPEDVKNIAKVLYNRTLRDLMTRSNEITNGKVAVRLDEYNIKKTLDDARAIRDAFGNDKVLLREWSDGDKEYASYTGEKYYERIAKMVDVAYKIMEGTLVPDIFDKLPLKKDGTFKQDQTIVLFDGKISDIATYEGGLYNAGDKLCLGITTGDDWWSSNKGCVSTSGTVGRLAIITLKTTRKLYPLLDEELEEQDIKTKTTYLKQEDVKPGSVYAEKSGTRYLYLGGAEWGPYGVHHFYVRYTKKWEELAQSSKNLHDLCLKMRLGPDSKAHSARENPRKFVAEIEEVFPPMALDKDQILGYR